MNLTRGGTVIVEKSVRGVATWVHRPCSWAPVVELDHRLSSKVIWTLKIHWNIWATPGAIGLQTIQFRSLDLARLKQFIGSQVRPVEETAQSRPTVSVLPWPAKSRGSQFDWQCVVCVLKNKVKNESAPKTISSRLWCVRFCRCFDSVPRRIFMVLCLKGRLTQH